MPASRGYLFFCGLMFTALLSGCVGANGYNDLGGGYSEAYRTGFLPDSAGHTAILYSCPSGARQHVWPTLMNGYYGNTVVHDDLIAFQACRPTIWNSQGGAPAFYSAKSGPPAVEITEAVRAKMAGAVANASPLDVDYSIEYSRLERANSGIRIIFPTRGANPKDQAEWHEVIITWPEIENLVTRERAAGKSHHFQFVEYFTAG